MTFNLSSLSIGQTFHSRGGSAYTLTEIRTTGRGAGITIQRSSTGKNVRVSLRLINSCLARLQAGEQLRYQANQPQGGISFTVAVEAGVAFALSSYLKRDDANRCYVAA